MKPGTWVACLAVLAATEAAAEVIPTECIGEILGPSPQEFYPPHSKRRKQQGDVIFDYGVKRLTPFLVDVLLVSSSGYVELDNAALEFTKHLSQRKHCPGKRYRMIESP